MRVVALLCLMLACRLSIAQQSTIKGVVSIHNSETLTGKRQYVSNAQVEDEFGKSTPQVTDGQGQFQLVFVNQSDKSSVSFLVTKPGLQVVNQTALSAVAGQQDIVKISMANPDSINEYRRRIYNVGKTEGEKRLENLLKSKNGQLAELKKNATQNAVRIKGLEADLAKLEQEGNGLEQQVKELARKYAPVNLDDATALVRDAFKLFQNGLVDSAVLLLEGAGLKQNVQLVLEEREKIAAIRQETNQREAKANETVKGYAEALQLKAELHKLKYEFDSVSACYELLIQLDTTNGNYLLDYAFFLEWINQFDKAILQSQKALAMNRQLAKNDLHKYEPEVAKALNRQGVYYEDNSNYAKAEVAFNEAMAIRAKLVKENPAAYEADLAQTKSFLGYLYWNEGEYAKAEAVMLEALAIYERLVKSNAKQYEPDVAKLLDNLGVVYDDTKRATEAESVFLRAVAIRKRIAAETPGATNDADLSRAQDDLGISYKNRELYDKAAAAFTEALIIRQRLAKENPQSYEPHLADTYNNYASLYWAKKEYSKAIESYNKALSIFTKRAASNPEAYQKFAAATLENLGRIYIEIKNFTAAEKALTAMLAIGEKWMPVYPEAYSVVYVNAVSNMTALYLSLPDSLLPAWAKDEKIQTLETRLLNYSKTNPVVAKNSFSYFGDNSWYACTVGKFSLAEKYALKAMQLAPSKTWVQTNLAHALLFQGKYEVAQKQYQKLIGLKDETGKPFATVCLEDLAILEAGGFTNSYVSKIKAMLKK